MALHRPRAAVQRYEGLLNVALFRSAEVCTISTFTAVYVVHVTVPGGVPTTCIANCVEIESNRLSSLVFQ